MSVAAAGPSDSPVQDSPADSAAPPSGWGRWWPYALIALVTLYCHWFILTNDGPIWDGWYWQYWLEFKRWEPMLEYTRAQGLPYTLWAFAPFAFVPHMIPAFMCASFLCLVAEGFLIFVLARKLAGLPLGEALSVTLLAQAIPMFSAAQDFPVFGLIVFRTLFFASVFAAARSLDTRGARHWWWRGAALIGFYFSCITNGALLVFYGAAWLLFLVRFRRLHPATWEVAIRRFILRFPDFFLVPPAVFAARTVFIPQFGWYENYNKPGAHFDFIHETFWSFFANVVPYHVKTTGGWFLEHPIGALLVAVGFALWLWKAPPSLAMTRSGVRTSQLLSFGSVALVFAVFPVAAGGKFFDEFPVGEPSRHCMLTNIPVAVLLLALVRSAAFWSGMASSRVLPGLVAAMVLVFGSQYWPIYLRERIETLFSQSALAIAGRAEIFRRSSIILNGDISATRQRIYGTCAFARAFGGLTRLVVPVAPRIDFGYLPSDTEWHALTTTVVPNEFNRIDPSGTQIQFSTTRNRGSATDVELAWRDVRLRWAGVKDAHDQFLISLTSLAVGILRERSFMVAATEPPRLPRTASTAMASGPFSNSIGMEFVPLPWGGWAGKYETTQAQYERVMSRNPSLFIDPWRPVERVTWHDAVEFCRQLTQAEAGRLPSGFVYRLPTGAEWDQLAADAWFSGSAIIRRDVKWETSGVGTFQPNRFGLFDTVGNVWEWCADFWDDEHRFKVSKGGAFSSEADHLEPRAWHDSDHGFPISRRVWLTAASFERLAGRARRDYPDQAFWNRGFRVVLAGPPPAPLQPARLRER